MTEREAEKERERARETERSEQENKKKSKIQVHNFPVTAEYKSLCSAALPCFSVRLYYILRVGSSIRNMSDLHISCDIDASPGVGES